MAEAETITTKRCTKCGETKSRDDFRRRVSWKDTRRSHCKACVTSHEAGYRAAHLKERKAQHADHYQLTGLDHILGAKLLRPVEPPRNRSTPSTALIWTSRRSLSRASSTWRCNRSNLRDDPSGSRAPCRGAELLVAPGRHFEHPGQAGQTYSTAVLRGFALGASR